MARLGPLKQYLQREPEDGDPGSVDPVEEFPADDKGDSVNKTKMALYMGLVSLSFDSKSIF